MTPKLTLAAPAALTIVLSLNLLAAERATFILRNGQRESGVLSAHTEQRTNLVLGYFNLGDMPGGTGSLRERAYPAADVVAIDFAGGNPPQQELAALNRMNGQPNMLVLRDGSIVYGRFDNIVDGATVSFDNQTGQRQTYGVRDVARVYLDTAAARTLFNVPPDQAASGQGASRRPAVGVDRQPIDQGARGTRDRQSAGEGGPGFRVSATGQWTDTGRLVRRGDRVSFRATGEIQFGESDRDVAGPDGNPRLRMDPNDLPVRRMPIGGLIGRIGRGAPFAIGSNPDPIVMPADGRLYLGVNADSVTGARGAFRVEVIERRR
jgi:hypothetical protein